MGLTLGLASPGGDVGLDVSHRFTHAFDLDVGAGEAFSGPQASVMPRYRLGSHAVSGSLGAGVSAGRLHTWGVIDDTDASMTTYATWANVEAGVQLTAQSGFFVRGFAGYSQMIANTGWTCDGNCDGYRNEPSGMPYLGFTFGTEL